MESSSMLMNVEYSDTVKALVFVIRAGCLRFSEVSTVFSGEPMMVDDNLVGYVACSMPLLTCTMTADDSY